MPQHPNAARPAGGAAFALAGTIEPTRLSPGYRAGLVVVALAMLLLPILYVGIIALAGSAVWWHLSANTWIFDGRGGVQWRLIAYLAPAVAGGVVMLFMVKPLLARPATRPEPVRVAPEDEPALFEFVRQICAQVRAPVPRRVQVDCNVNASAGLLRGVLRRDLVLTIGLPLVSGLTVRELGGVLAHEFGHFAQGGALRVTAIVRGTNAWFARVVYERDAWDETLERWSKETDWRLAAVLMLARGGVWVSRRVLTGLMWTGHAISCFMMRQMEYDADSYEVKFAGTEAFARTSARLRELSLASGAAYSDLRDGVNAGAIPSDLPSYIVSRRERIPADVLARVCQVPAKKTGIFDTHPSDADRVQAADAASLSGVLVGGDGPATELFAGFESLCAAATRHHYEHDLGLDPDSLSFVSVDAAASDMERRHEGRRALMTMCQGCLSPLRPLRVALRGGADLPELVGASAAAREKMQGLANEQLRAEYAQVESLESVRLNAFLVDSLFEAGFTNVDGPSFGLPAGTREAAESARAAAARQQRAIAQALAPFEEAFSMRLSCALTIGMQQSRASTPDEKDQRAETTGSEAALVAALNALADASPTVAELRSLVYAEAVVEGNQPSSPDAAATRRCLARLGMRTENLLRRLNSILAAAQVPPPLAADALTLAAYCGLSASATPSQSASIAERVSALHLDLLGHAAGLTLEIEQERAAAIG